jgi:hypothetical protein
LAYTFIISLFDSKWLGKNKNPDKFRVEIGDIADVVDNPAAHDRLFESEQGHRPFFAVDMLKHWCILVS